MSLNFELGSIKDYETLVWDEKGQMRPLTNTIIWNTMTVDMGSITEKNAAEFYDRMKIVEKVYGAFMQRATDNGFEDILITPEDIKAHIGLVTNVTTKSRSAFLKRLRAAALDKVLGRRVGENPVTEFPAVKQAA